MDGFSIFKGLQLGMKSVWYIRSSLIQRTFCHSIYSGRSLAALHKQELFA